MEYLRKVFMRSANKTRRSVTLQPQVELRYSGTRYDQFSLTMAFFRMVPKNGVKYKYCGP